MTLFELLPCCNGGGNWKLPLNDTDVESTNDRGCGGDGGGKSCRYWSQDDWNAGDDGKSGNAAQRAGWWCGCDANANANAMRRCSSAEAWKWIGSAHTVRLDRSNRSLPKLVGWLTGLALPYPGLARSGRAS